MADNVTVDNGALTDIPVATDDVGGQMHQRVKVDLGGDGVSSPLVRGQQTIANSLPVTLASDQPDVDIIAKPQAFSTFGHYKVSSTTGTLAAALAAGTGSAGHVFAARWGDATRLALILSLRTRFLPLTPFTANTLTDHTSFDAFVVRSYSASHSGGTALTPTGNNAKMRTSMGTSLFTDMRISTTAALTSGTHTFDAFPFAQSIRKGNRVNPAAATEEVIMPTMDGLNYEPDIASGEHPITLAQNEGIIVRNRTVWPAAGTGILLVELSWAEVAAF